MAPIALLGTGLLGSGMARHLLKGGTSVIVWNRTESKARALEADGAVVADSPAAAVAGVPRVHLVLQDDGAVEKVIEAIAPALSPGAVVVDHTTTLPALTRTRAERLAARGIRYLHAPVFMSPTLAADGGGLMLASGPRAIFEAVRAGLEGMTGEVWYLGERPDLAAAYKLFGNAMLLAITAGMADVLTMARANDIAPADALHVFSKFKPTNAITARGPKMAAGDFAASFTMLMARKDAGLMLTAAGHEPLVALPAIAKRMDEVIAWGGGELDLAALGAKQSRIP